MDQLSYKRGVISRKTHHCSGCLKKWTKGTSWDVQVNVDGGDIWTWRECPICQEIKQLPHFEYEEMYEGDFREYDEYNKIEKKYKGDPKMDEMIEVSKLEFENMKKRIEHLEERDAWLDCLEIAGVDNWEGYSYACDIRDGVKYE